jgi:hypothetical protein
VLIDGRWGQLKSTPMLGRTVLVVWLDKPNESASLDLGEYNLVNRFRNTVDGMKDRFTPDQISSIHWGPEQDQNPGLKLQVTVFGEYVKNKKY